MGHYANYSGRIEIDPPMPWGMIKDSPSTPGPNFASDIRLAIEESTVDTDEGVMCLRRAVAIEPALQGRFKGYDMEGHLRAVVALSWSDSEARTFTGRIEAVGEDGDRWRFAVVDGMVRRFEPALTWPPESE